MLEAGGHTLRLKSVHHGGRQQAAQQRILGEVLEVAATQGTALDVHPRPEHNIHAVGASLPAQGLTDLPDQRRIPGRGKRNSRREAGRREASTKTQVVGVLVVLDPQPVWSVRQPERPEASGREGCCRPVVRAGRQKDLLSNG